MARATIGGMSTASGVGSGGRFGMVGSLRHGGPWQDGTYGVGCFAEVDITYKDVDHVMIYDAFAYLPTYSLESHIPQRGRYVHAVILGRRRQPRVGDNNALS
jgi:hypothetical protein